VIWPKKRSREEEYRALLIQYEEILSKLRRENKELKKRLEDAERRVQSALKLFFPELYAKKKPSDLDQALRLLVDGLDSMRRELQRLRESRIVSPEATGETLQEERPDAQRIKARLRKLSEKEVEALKLALMGFCTVNSLSREMKIEWREADALLSRLHDKGFLDVLRVKPSREPRGFPVFFPSPHGEAAAEVLFEKPWSLVHAEVLKEKGAYLDNLRLIKEAEVRLRHSGYRVVTELEDPSECTFRYSEGNHRADLVVYAFDKTGREVRVFLECESMSNPISQVEKMLRAHMEAFGKIYVVVSSGLAKRMMLQRACLWAWREKRELVFEVRVEEVGCLTRLSSMPKYIIVRPPPRTP